MANVPGVENDQYMSAIMANSTFKSRLPQITRDNFAAVGDQIMDMPALKNEFIETLFNKIALTLLKNKKYTSKLDIFNKGTLEYGETVEEIMVDLITAKNFDENEDDSEVSGLVSSALPPVKTMYTSENYKHKYKVTISDARLKKAFHNKYGLDNLISGILTSVQNSIAYDRELMLKAMLVGAEYKSRNLVDPVKDTASAKAFVSKIKKTIIEMETMGKSFNKSDINTFTPLEDMVLVLTASVATTIDIELLATAFNIDKAEIKTKVIVIPDYPLSTVNGAKRRLLGVLMDKNFIMDYQTLYQVRTFENANSLSTNIFYHVWGMMNQSNFTNASSFYTAE